MDIFNDLVVAGIPLVAVIIGLVQYIKSFGLSGNAVKLLSLAVGIIFGVGYKLTTAPPVTFADWFAVAVFGIALGLGASGLYDANKTNK